MSLKNMIHRKKRQSHVLDASKEADLSDEELRQLRELALEASWAYATFPPAGFSGAFWYFH